VVEPRVAITAEIGIRDNNKTGKTLPTARFYPVTKWPHEGKVIRESVSPLSAFSPPIGMDFSVCSLA
jgi:hypothetical protein